MNGRSFGAARRTAAGLSMVEVLVTLVIVATGLLGFAKLQAAALSSTQNARVRSLVALQAASLAAAMSANPRFWSSASAPASLRVHGGRVDDPGGALGATADCRRASCTPAQLAAYDLQAWAENLQVQFPSHDASVGCRAVPGRPPHCTIELSWTEKSVAINRSTARPAAEMTATQRYSLYVEP
jgi:type IV pilus assembly protein PilV